MKTLQIDQLKLKELSTIESKTITAGDGFAHDVGRFFRFMYINATEGYNEAVYDLAVNTATCDCD